MTEQEKRAEWALANLEKNRQVVEGLEIEILRLDTDMMHEIELESGWSNEKTREVAQKEVRTYRALEETSNRRTGKIA